MKHGAWMPVINNSRIEKGNRNALLHTGDLTENWYDLTETSMSIGKFVFCTGKFQWPENAVKSNRKVT